MIGPDVLIVSILASCSPNIRLYAIQLLARAAYLVKRRGYQSFHLTELFCIFGLIRTNTVAHAHKNKLHQFRIPVFTACLRLRVYRKGSVRLAGQRQGKRRLAHAVLSQQHYPQRPAVAVVGRLGGRRLAEGLSARHRCVSDRQRGRLVQAGDPIAVLGHGLFPPQLVFDWQGRAPTAEGGCRGEKHTVLEMKWGHVTERHAGLVWKKETSTQVMFLSTFMPFKMKIPVNNQLYF